MNGEVGADLTGYTASWFLNTPFGKKAITPTASTPNIGAYTFTYLGKDQTHTGDYSITLKLTTSSGGQKMIDSFIIFKLVRCSVEAGDESNNISTKNIAVTL
jgi:hypothetical protein